MDSPCTHTHTHKHVPVHIWNNVWIRYKVSFNKFTSHVIKNSLHMNWILIESNCQVSAWKMIQDNEKNALIKWFSNQKSNEVEFPSKRLFANSMQHYIPMQTLAEPKRWWKYHDSNSFPNAIIQLKWNTFYTFSHWYGMLTAWKIGNL